MYSIWHEMLKIAPGSGELTTLPIPPGRYGLLPFGSRSFVPSAPGIIPIRML